MVLSMSKGVYLVYLV